MQPQSLLVLFAHGSKDPNWRKPFETLTSVLQDEMEGDSIALAYMEFVPPTLMSVATQAVAAGVSRMRILPLFLAGGAHVAKDIPRLVAEVEQQFPQLQVQVLPPIGEYPQMRHLIREIAREEGLKLGSATPS